MNKKYKILGLFILIMLVLASCGGKSETIQIGSKEFTEQYLLGNMYQMMLEDAGFDAEFQPIGSTTQNHEAMLNDEIDIYPEYTGTALVTHLGISYDPSMSADDVYQTVSEAYKEKFNIVWGDQTSFNNTYCLTMTQEKADELGVSTLSELSTKTNDLVFGTVQEFTERDDGLPGLQALYGGFEFKEVIGLDPGLLYSGLAEGDIDLTTCFGTDGQISAYDLVVLEDDMGFWPPYPVGPVIRQEVVDKHPEVLETLNKLAPLLDNQTMSSLNWEVAGNGREPDEVAHDFLLEHGLISE